MHASHVAMFGSIAAAAALGFAATGASLPALAGDVSVAAFKTVELSDGGSVVIRSGAQQRVTMVEGDPRFTHIAVDGEGKLRIRTECNNDCPHRYRLRVEVVTPHLAGAAVQQGGSIRAEGNFTPQSDIAAAVHQGGTVDVRAIHAANVAAAVHQGGSVMVTAEHNLTAAVNQGGQVTFWGHPVRIARAINQGGQVHGAEMADSEMHGRTVSVLRTHGHTDVDVGNDDEDMHGNDVDEDGADDADGDGDDGQ